MSALDPAQQPAETIYDRLGGDAGVRELVGDRDELHPQREMPHWHW